MAQCLANPRPFACANRPVRQSSRATTVCMAQQQPRDQQLSRRDVLGSSMAAALSAGVLVAQPAKAGFKKELKKRKVSLDDYTTSDVFGLKYFDEASGTGAEIKQGDRVMVHFDVMYRGIDVASSRYARLLGGNRTISEPFEFIVGEPVGAVAGKRISEGANGLFSGQGGPEPPIVLSTAVVGMKDGGKRTVRVDDPEVGYRKKRVGEMDAGQPFDLKIEVLQVVKK